MTAVKIALASLLIYATQASAQLQYSAPAVDAEGMGGIEASLPSDNAVAQLANPAQTGLFSLHGIASMAAYIPVSSYERPGSQGSIQGSTFSSAAEFGIDLQKYLRTPFGFSAGIGYARTGVDASGGAGWAGPEITNRADNLTLGLGFSDVVKIGIGAEMNWVTSSSSSSYPGQTMSGNILAQGYGVIVQLPIVEIIEGEQSWKETHGLRPLADLTVSYAMKNIGNILLYDSNPAFSEMLYRQADLGINFDLGFESTFEGQPWRIISVTLAREADEPLWRLDSTLVVYTVGANRPDSVYNYINVPTNSPRYFNPYQNFILGNSLGKDGIRTGGQVQFAEFLYLRLGATAGPVIGGSTMYGFGFRLKGLLRLLAVVENMPHPQGSVISFLMKHVDLRYDYSSVPFGYGGGGQSYSELNLEIE